MRIDHDHSMPDADSGMFLTIYLGMKQKVALRFISEKRHNLSIVHVVQVVLPRVVIILNKFEFDMREINIDRNMF